MPPISNKWLIIGGVLLALILALVVFLVVRSIAPDLVPGANMVDGDSEAVGIAARHSVIGASVEGRDISAYQFGSGETHLIFVGGVHGGYEWNSVFLAYRVIDYLTANPSVIPNNISLTIVPAANPDGIYKVIGKEGRFAAAETPSVEATIPGRFNARGVDLNRNFDCKWQPTSTWKGQEVSAGTSAFSEPEAVAIRDLVLKEKPAAVVFWHSQAKAVYASECENGVLPQTLDIMNAYAKASGYTPVQEFDAYAITGDAEGWLASIGIPAITVEMETHETLEWDSNLAGVKALFKYYSATP